jgi:transposase
MHSPISRARYLQESRVMRFTQTYEEWEDGRLTQAQAALILGMSERNFRRHIERYEADGLSGLLDKRLSQISHRKAAASEVDHVVSLYKSSFTGWSVAHFHSKYQTEFKGQRSHSWVKIVLQCAGAIKTSSKRGKHRI